MDPATTAAAIVPTDPIAIQSAVLVGSITAILVGGELFTTGIEWLSEAFGLTESSTGSILAALATTLPETLIPVLAIASGSGASIGLGAILGGPITLTTFALGVLGAAAVVATVRGSRSRLIEVNPGQTGRDLRVFLGGFALAAAVGFLGGDVVKLVVAAALVGLYGWYLATVIGPDEDEGDTDFDPEPLELGRIPEWIGDADGAASREGEYRTNPPRKLVVAQLLLAAALLLGGAHFFVQAITWLAETVLGAPETIVALLLAPLVSNVPENVDGAIWMVEDQDVLAVEQVTGTLAFQGTVVVAIGVLFTPWNLSVAWGTTDFLVVAAVAISLLTGVVFYLLVRAREGTVRPHLLLGLGTTYGLFLALVGFYAVAGYV